ncbi:MAG: filamentous hemagglutinin N-terminal domain-containing protein [Gammaproteobacteria bacterium]|nr:filamentous hemagglutinin N-terminal domain-containing protein [Gammaproteobacteria bacterium]
MSNHSTLLYLCLSAISFTGYCQETRITSSGLGTSIDSPRQEEGGVFYDISSDSRQGENIFFSFDQFSIGEGDVANFINSEKQSVKNIISRVTGGEPSLIHGEINTREYGEADLFFVNPNGITFGEGAKLNVGGSFHASTTDRVVFKDGAVFSADLSDPVMLSSAEPESFGFLDNSLEAIKVENSVLESDSGKAISLVGGDVEVNNGVLEVTGGMINIDAQTLLMNNKSVLKSKSATGVDTTNTEKNGIVINLVDDLDLQNGSRITSSTSSEAIHAGNISITVENGGVKISGESIGLFSSTSSKITSSANDGGVAGNISISALKLELTDDGRIQATSNSFGEQSAAGNITLLLDELTIDQGGQVLNQVSGDSVGGTITINTNTINIVDDITDPKPSIQSETKGSGDAGNIFINPLEKNLVIKGNNGTISADSARDATGNAGSINIETPAGDLLIADGINISAKTSWQGLGGGITVNGKNVDITNGVNLTAESLFVQEGLPTGSDNSEFGKSGSISVTANERLVVDNSNINLNTQEADAGNIVIRAGRLFRMDNQSKITTSVADGNGDGGDIRINEEIDSNLVVLSNSSEIRANARQGAGGNINIKAYSHLISPDSIIDASAGPAGIDGAVTVTTPDVDATTGMLQLPESFLDVSALLGNRCAMRTASNSNSSSFLVSSNRDESTPDELLVSDTSNLDDVSKNSVLEQIAMRCW